MSDKITIDKRDSALLKENNLLKTDDETVTIVPNNEFIISTDSALTHHVTAINKILTNSVYGLTMSTKEPNIDLILTELKDKVRCLLIDVEALKSKIDELEKENELLRSRVDKADAENEELRYRDGVLERHISELKLKFML